MEPGQCYDVLTLLSTPQRDFLVRNNGDQVSIECLKGKTIGLHFVQLELEYEAEYSYTECVINTYKDLKFKDCFEVVLIAAVEDDEETDMTMFEACFNMMPWLAIPPDDFESRKRLLKMCPFTLPFPCCVILDPSGEVLRRDAIEYLNAYAGECYPFTDERIIQLKEEDIKARSEGSLASLLTSPSRDYLVTSQWTEVHVSELEGKVVALYFYNRLHCESFVPKLADIYKRLKNDRGENFEIVLINYHRTDKDEEEFEEDFEKMPWLAWPVTDKKYTRLREAFSCEVGSLVIIGPNREFVDDYGAEVIQEYGIEAYPFTREAPAHLEVKKLKALSLRSLLAYESHNFVIGREGSKVGLPQLAGKTILLFLATLSCSKCVDIMNKLIEWYNQIKMKDEAFEVIYVSWDEDETSFQDNYSKMPWFTLPFNKDHVQDLCSREKLHVERQSLPVLIVFGPDGRILTKGAKHIFQNNGIDAYPFRDDDFFEEIYYEILKEHMWPIIDMYGRRCYVL